MNFILACFRLRHYVFTSHDTIERRSALKDLVNDCFVVNEAKG